ncbi:MAG: hypothetical protein Q4C77_08870 [Eubacteriales bacterium]|nr:hypothetical protein [Eubacteriales bacterium]
MEKRQIGGEITNFDQAAVFPIIPGMEILYFGKECPEQEQKTYSKLKDLPSTIIVQKCTTSDFCIIYRMGKHLPTAFIRYSVDMVILINPEQICIDDMQVAPVVWQYIQDMANTFQIDQRFCVVKAQPEMKEIFEELQSIPLPPRMFRFYMLLKVTELFLQFSAMNLYSARVHFYPYRQKEE